MLHVTASGKNTARPELEAMLDYARDGDTIIVHSMDRLARNLDDLRKLVTQLTAQHINVQFVKESLTFTGADSSMSKLLLSVIGAFAEFERSLIKERQIEGIALAKNVVLTEDENKCYHKQRSMRSKRSLQVVMQKAALLEILALAEKLFINI